jgi:hypothetical protein
MRKEIQVRKCTALDRKIVVYDPWLQRGNKEWVQLFVLSISKVMPFHRETIENNSVEITNTGEGRIALQNYYFWKSQRNPAQKKNNQTSRPKAKSRKNYKQAKPDLSKSDIRDHYLDMEKCPHGIPKFKLCAICDPKKYKAMWG